MTSIIHRSFIVSCGRNPPAELAYIVDDPWNGRRVVTWADVMRERREYQERRLRDKRHVDQWRAYKVWVAYYDMDLFGGWQAFIENGDRRVWIDRDCKGLKPELMRLFPLVIPFDDGDHWYRWKISFARQYRRGTHHRKPRGVRFVWWNGKDSPQRTRPSWARMPFTFTKES